MQFEKFLQPAEWLTPTTEQGHYIVQIMYEIHGMTRAIFRKAQASRNSADWMRKSHGPAAILPSSFTERQ
jgi:hypothetical protein